MKCDRCQQAIIGGWVIDGTYEIVCLGCLNGVIALAGTEMAPLMRAATETTDSGMGRHARHVTPALDCVFCGYGV